MSLIKVRSYWIRVGTKPNNAFLKNLALYFLLHLFIWLYQVLVESHGIFSCLARGLSSLTKDRTWAPYIGSMES